MKTDFEPNTHRRSIDYKMASNGGDSTLNAARIFAGALFWTPTLDSNSWALCTAC